MSNQTNETPLAYCLIGDVTGQPHGFKKGTGVMVPWDVMGDARSAVEVCRSCADQTESGGK